MFYKLPTAEDDEVRQGLKEFSNWPTYPQLYVNGKLVGGLDIVTEMAEDGNLKSKRTSTNPFTFRHPSCFISSLI